MMKNKEDILQGLAACADFCCGECTYQHLEDSHFSMRCIHALIKDLYELLKE